MADEVAKVAVAVAYVFMIVLNGLSATGVFGPDIGTISDEYPTYVTPAGITFAIWGVIYTLFLAFVVVQCIGDDATEYLLQQGFIPVRWRVVMAFVLNGIWLPVYVQLYFGVALAIILAYLGVLLWITFDVNILKTNTFCEYLTLAAPFSANASWLVVASTANAFTLFGELGWKDQYGVAGTPNAAAAAVVLVASLALLRVYIQEDIAWPYVASWALAGIYLAQTVEDATAFPPQAMSLKLAYVAAAGSVVCLIAGITAFVIACCRGWMRTDASFRPLMPNEQARMGAAASLAVVQ